MTVQPKAGAMRKALEDNEISLSRWQRRHEGDNVVSRAKIQASSGVHLPRHRCKASLHRELCTLLQCARYDC